MNEFSDLQTKTAEFFQLHWPSGNEEAPQWIKWDPFLSAPGPNYDKVGCYALFAGPEVFYLGVGMAKGKPGSRYENHGISARLNHVMSADHEKGSGYKLKEKWANLGINGAYTLGFTKYTYLALALENFLITEMRPRENSLHNSL